MRVIEHDIRFNGNGAHDAAIVLDGDDPLAALAESVVESINIDVEVTLGGKTVTLAMLQNAEHWSEDWTEAIGDEDPGEWVAALVVDR